MSEELKQAAANIFLHALESCSIERAFRRALRVEQREGGRWLIVHGWDATELTAVRHVRVLALGKAATPMLEALLGTVVFEGCDVGGLVIAPESPQPLPAGFAYFAGGHPVPNAASFAAARAGLEMARAAAREPESTLCLFLLSGGGSSMMELPLDEAIGLEETIGFHRALVGSGASIVEMNCVRKHHSAVKGGRLAIASGGARRLSLLVSDVPPERLDTVASGPTLPDPTTAEQCREIVRRYGMAEHFHARVRAFFAGEIPETPKPGELEPNAHVLLSSAELCEAARRSAEALGFTVVIDNSCDDWPYDRAADSLLARVRQLRREQARVCVISCGEVTVNLPASLPGAARGGRNQQWALYMASRLRAQDSPVAALSCGSDGIDGNSPAAGAVVDEQTADGDAEQALRCFDAHGYLSARGATLTTGATGQNLRDLRIVLAG